MRSFLKSVVCIILIAAVLMGLASCSPKGQAMIDVDFISQVKKYPTGCESVSAVMALNYAGIDVTVDDFIDHYLPMGNRPFENESGQKVGADPYRFFVGNPYESTGYGCFAPVIAGAVEDVLKNGYDGYRVKELNGKSLEFLCRKYLDNDIPVILWATIGMKKATRGTSWTIEDTGESFNWIKPMHCLLLVGYDEDYYYFNDPLAGKQCKYKKDAVIDAYKAMAKQAVVVVKK